ncbi:MAG: SPOR domain-containing protein [Nitrospiraceae bacterium]|nr:SPOR domain-containing protein [Nitrospiraceae bacterium]
MKPKAIEKTSIILLSKSTAVLGSIVIAFVSMVAGYLFGVSSVNVDQSAKPQETKKPETALPADEKRVLEPSTANATPPVAAAQQQMTSPQPIKPIIPPKEPAFVPVPQAAQQPVQPQTQKQPLPQPQQIQPQQQMQSVPQQQPHQYNEAAPAKKQQSERSLLKGTQNDMKMPLVRGEAAPAAPAVQMQQPAQQQKKAAMQAGTAKPVHAPKKHVSAASAAAGKYTVQFGAFPTKEGAENLKKRLSSKNIKAYILNRKDPNDYFRVRSGSYPTKDAAQKAATSLKASTGVDNFVAPTGR